MCGWALIHDEQENTRTYQEAVATWEPAPDFAEYTPEPVDK